MREDLAQRSPVPPAGRPAGTSGSSRSRAYRSATIELVDDGAHWFSIGCRDEVGTIPRASRGGMLGPQRPFLLWRWVTTRVRTLFGQSAETAVRQVVPGQHDVTDGCRGGCSRSRGTAAPGSCRGPGSGRLPAELLRSTNSFARPVGGDVRVAQNSIRGASAFSHVKSSRTRTRSRGRRPWLRRSYSISSSAAASASTSRSRHGDAHALRGHQVAEAVAVGRDDRQVRPHVVEDAGAEREGRLDVREVRATRRRPPRAGSSAGRRARPSVSLKNTCLSVRPRRSLISRVFRDDRHLRHVRVRVRDAQEEQPDVVVLLGDLRDRLDEGRGVEPVVDAAAPDDDLVVLADARAPRRGSPCACAAAAWSPCRTGRSSMSDLRFSSWRVVVRVDTADARRAARARTAAAVRRRRGRSRRAASCSFTTSVVDQDLVPPAGVTASRDPARAARGASGRRGRRP